MASLNNFVEWFAFRCDDERYVVYGTALNEFFFMVSSKLSYEFRLLIFWTKALLK